MTNQEVQGGEQEVYEGQWHLTEQGAEQVLVAALAVAPNAATFPLEIVSVDSGN